MSAALREGLSNTCQSSCGTAMQRLYQAARGSRRPRSGSSLRTPESPSNTEAGTAPPSSRAVCAAQSSAARTARPGAPFAQKVSPFVARTPIEKISCAGRRFHLSPRAADEIFQPLAKRPIPSKMRQWQKGQGSAQVAPASMPAPPWTVESAPPWTVESAFGARACETPQLRVSSARAPAGRALR